MWNDVIKVCKIVGNIPSIMSPIYNVCRIVGNILSMMSPIYNVCRIVGNILYLYDVININTLVTGNLSLMQTLERERKKNPEGSSWGLNAGPPDY